MSCTRTIRIGNGAGFWGDQLDAPRVLAESGELDYLTLEYLAELTLSILAHQRHRDPAAGFVSDFAAVVQSLIPQLLVQPNLKIVTNAGGMNPIGCAQAVSRILCDSNLHSEIVAAVYGDDVLPHLDELAAVGELFAHFDDGRAIDDVRDSMTSANVYLGADGIARALNDGARIVVTGRIADASLVVAPALTEFGWRHNDWDLLAAATTAGHLIECGAQVTGGMYSGWASHEFELDEIGYPIAELSANGECVITKPDGSDGRVDVATVSEQLVYEIGDPREYVTPDVVADFSNVQLQQVGVDRVRVSNCRGTKKPASYKVSMSWANGFFGANTLTIAGPIAVERAAACESAIRSRLARINAVPAELEFEYLGTGATVPGAEWTSNECSPPEIVLRGAARDPSRDVIERFLREFAPLVTSGPPGVTGYTGARPRSIPVLGYWPATISREHVESQCQVRTAQEWCDV